MKIKDLQELSVVCSVYGICYGINELISDVEVEKFPDELQECIDNLKKSVSHAVQCIDNYRDHRNTILHAIETALDMSVAWNCQIANKDDHESSFVIRPAIQKADEALTVLRDELKRELREAFGILNYGDK